MRVPRPLFVVLVLVTQAWTRDVWGAEPRWPDVGQWERFERVVENPRPYPDPYRDVTLDVTYESPNGTTVRFWGFHDGGRTWRFRFMPDTLGTWKYTAKFSDGSPGPSGKFECVPSQIPGLIGAYAHNPLWFGWKGGGPVQIRSFHVGDRFLAQNWPAAKRRAFLEWAGRQGYNMLSIASHYSNRNKASRGQGWETPDLWPLDAARYRRVEALLDELAARRFLVFPFAGFFGRDGAFPRDPAQQTAYIKYVLARLGPYWNVILNVAGPEPNHPDNPYLPPEEVARLGAEIRRLDPFGHLLTVHNATGDDPYRDAPWPTLHTLQGGKTRDRARLRDFLLSNRAPGRPMLAHETLWPGNKYQLLEHEGVDYSPEDIRKNAYVILLAGAALNFADMKGDSSSGFSGTLELDQRVQARHDIVKVAWDFLQSLPFHRMRPCPEAVSAGHCLGEPGREYAVYLDAGGRVDLKVRRGPTYQVQWIDPRDPRKRQPGGTTRTGLALEAPGPGDWLLHVAVDRAPALTPYEQGAVAAVASDQIHLAWTKDPARTLTVVWRTLDPDHPSVLEYRATGERAWRSARGGRRPSGTTGTLHEVTLTGLEPGTRYQYRVAGNLQAYEARTAPEGSADFSAVYVADTGLVGRDDGLATGTRQVVDEVAALDPLLVLLGGDYPYYNTDKRFGTLERTMDAWFNQMAPIATRAPMMPTYGNHEHQLDEGYGAWEARFPTPAGFDRRRNYSFDVGDVHFVSLFAGSHDDQGVTPEQLAWLDRDLATARRAGRRWLVPFLHSAPFSDGENHPDNLPLRAQLGPVFERHGVKVVLTSHDQAFERTFPLMGVPKQNRATSRRLRCYGTSDGVTWVKSGPGGKMSNISGGFASWRTDPAPPWTAVRDNRAHHVSRLVVKTEGVLRVETFGIMPDGAAPTLVDHFEYRTGACPPEPEMPVAEAPVFLERDGRVVIEAERFATRVARRPKGFRTLHRWETRSGQPGHVGAGYVRALPDERKNGGEGPASPRDATGPELRYRFRTTSPGTYRVWVRGLANGAEDNGVHVGVDGRLVIGPRGASDISGFRPFGEWRWESRRKHEVGGGHAEVTLAAGEHMLHVWMRDDGFSLDRILLTRETSVPEGGGPPESQTVLGPPSSER